MKTTFKLLTIITSLLLIFACSNKPSGSEYLGKWALKLKYAYWEMNITRVNESFLVEGTFNQDGIYTITKENNLVQSGIIGTTITYDKNTNTLIVSSGDDIDRWTRLQDEGEGNQDKNKFADKTGKNSNSVFQKIKRFFKKEVMDIDGNVYSTIKIGKQVWMVENLKTTKLNNGHSLAYLYKKNEWCNASIAGYCWPYSFYVEDLERTYGALYNWYTVKSGVLCPKGWHIPSDDEWKQLEMYLGMPEEDLDVWGNRSEGGVGGKLKENGTTHWYSEGDGTTNESGFTALPDGYRQDDGTWGDCNYAAYFWCSDDSGLYRKLHHSYSTVIRNGSLDEKEGFSVRCIKD